MDCDYHIFYGGSKIGIKVYSKNSPLFQIQITRSDYLNHKLTIGNTMRRAAYTEEFQKSVWVSAKMFNTVIGLLLEIDVNSTYTK